MLFGSGLWSNGSGWPEPSFLPCFPLSCEWTAAPCAGGPAAAERDLPYRDALSSTLFKRIRPLSILMSAHLLPIKTKTTEDTLW